MLLFNLTQNNNQFQCTFSNSFRPCKMRKFYLKLHIYRNWKKCFSPRTASHHVITTQNATEHHHAVATATGGSENRDCCAYGRRSTTPEGDD